jgi:hypothetical protein
MLEGISRASLATRYLLHCCMNYSTAHGAPTVSHLYPRYFCQNTLISCYSASYEAWRKLLSRAPGLDRMRGSSSNSSNANNPSNYCCTCTPPRSDDDQSRFIDFFPCRLVAKLLW